MNIVFTDLDGTLLDHETYSWEAARPAIERLKSCDVPWVLVTSKTRAEVELWRRQFDNRHPYIVENGAAAFVPHDYFSFPIPGAAQRDNYHVLEWGQKYGFLVSCLKEASRRSRCRVRGFHEMTAAEVSFTCDLPLEQAALAKLREYDEPFRILDIERAGELLKAIETQGLCWTKGGRFWHITGASDKGLAVTALRELFERAYGSVQTIGLGDEVNDAPFLKVVTVPVLIRSRGSAKLKVAVPHGILTEQPGPVGWNEAILKMIPA
jgi:mannosyl-3-phosphoglycerate phosphatase